MSDESVIGACCGICCLTCCESIVVALNFKKPGSRAGTTQRGCCRNLGESTEDDVFEENARKQRAAGSSKKHQGKNGVANGNGKEGKEGVDEAVTEQPVASPEMAAMPPATTTAVTEPHTDEVKAPEKAEQD